MSVRIRLSRFGRKNRPHYRIAVFDSETRRDGRYLELLGHYDPLITDPKTKVKLNTERLTAWVNKGALATPAVAQLLKHCRIAVPKAPKTAAPKAKEPKPAKKPAAAKAAPKK
ncbi:MAG: 30S ribosomal protein S16 [Candidatus Brocadiae bacterium]|nr:30S ribosomal protein S16 [Candidatus Brocadiia bacterium]